MADISIKKYRGKRYIGGASPIVPAYIQGDAPPPNNPPGSTGGGGVGITLNGKVIGGVKRLIEINDVLDIPLYWQYRVTSIDIDGIVNNDGEIIVS